MLLLPALLVCLVERTSTTPQQITAQHRHRAQTQRERERPTNRHTERQREREGKKREREERSSRRSHNTYVT